MKKKGQFSFYFIKLPLAICFLSMKSKDMDETCASQVAPLVSIGTQEAVSAPHI